MPHSSDAACLCPDCLPLAAHWLATRELSLARSHLQASLRATRAFLRVHDPLSEPGIRAYAAAARAKRQAVQSYTTAMATVRELAPHLAPTSAAVRELAAWCATDPLSAPSTLPQDAPDSELPTDQPSSPKPRPGRHQEPPPWSE